MHAAAATAALLGLSLFPPAAVAETTWLCSLTEDGMRLVCAADADPVHAAPTATAVTARVHGTTFPLSPARLYFVDLWSVPTDMEFVDQLARATICYRSPGCSVVVTRPAAAAAVPLQPLRGKAG
jgi:hypothetical protein